MKPVKDEDYIVIYAKELSNNNKFFEQHKKLIDSQINSSIELFRKVFGKKFKEEARKYLRATEIKK